MSRTRPRQERSRSPLSRSDSSETCQHGCGERFTFGRNRDAHERFYCPLLDDNKQGTPIASHATLGIPNTQCRVCGERSSRKDSTKRHESIAHGVTFTKSGSAYLPLEVEDRKPNSPTPAHTPNIIRFLIPPTGLASTVIRFSVAPPPSLAPPISLPPPTSLPSPTSLPPHTSLPTSVSVMACSF